MVEDPTKSTVPDEAEIADPTAEPPDRTARSWMDAGDHVTLTAASSAANFAAVIASIALAVVVGLAFSPAGEPTPADRVTLLTLAVLGAICFWTPLLRYFDQRPDAATFALTAALFIVYGIARRAGPDDGWALRLPALPDDPFVISWAARAVVIGAILALPLWWKQVSLWTRALLTGAAIVMAIGLSIFLFLRRYYPPVEGTEIVNPKLLVDVVLQAVEYSALALLCNAVCLHPAARRWALRVLPLVLLALWARHQFAPPAEVEGEEAE
jgi:hypothetical protein